MLRKLLINPARLKWRSACSNPAFRIHRCCVHSDVKTKTADEPTLKDFIAKADAKLIQDSEPSKVPYLDPESFHGNNQKVFFEIFGCQMNMNDADVVWSILHKSGYQKAENLEEADVIFLVTCSIRENAEMKIWERLYNLQKLKKSRLLNDGVKRPRVGLLGCMAERLKERVLEKDRTVDLVAGPDSYKDLPRLLVLTRANQKAVNVLLSLDETYADVPPMRLNEDSVTSFVSIMRGCDNMCTYCIVPFTRGRERSRPLDSIVDEIKILSDKGVKEVTLLGQNVNSYRDISKLDKQKEVDDRPPEALMAEGFKTVYKVKKGGIRFAELLDKVSSVDPEMRIRFTSPHPKDFPDDVLHMIKERPNICKAIHMPAQSGNSVILEKMRRGYTREAYLSLVQKIRILVPNVALSGDFILGFCGETEEQFQDTISLIKEVKYTRLFIYGYSLREKTTAYHRLTDDVPEEVKLQRVGITAEVFRGIADQLNKAQIGTHHLVLIEGPSRRSNQQLAGRNDNNIKVIIPKYEIPECMTSSRLKEVKPGDYVCVYIEEANSQTLKGIPLFHTTLQGFYSSELSKIHRKPKRNSVAYNN